MVAFAGFAIKLFLALLFWRNIDFIHRSGEIASLCLALSILTFIEYKSTKIKNLRYFSNIVGIAIGLSAILRAATVFLEFKIIDEKILDLNVYVNVFVAVLITTIGSSILSLIVLNKVGKIK